MIRTTISMFTKLILYILPKARASAKPTKLTPMIVCKIRFTLQALPTSAIVPNN